ncbi:MAG: hypothetical protein V1817_05060, partial [Candidatus Micrarchaeota archaeon]
LPMLIKTAASAKSESELSFATELPAPKKSTTETGKAPETGSGSKDYWFRLTVKVPDKDSKDSKATKLMSTACTPVTVRAATAAPGTPTTPTSTSPTGSAGEFSFSSLNFQSVTTSEVKLSGAFADAKSQLATYSLELYAQPGSYEERISLLAAPLDKKPTKDIISSAGQFVISLADLSKVSEYMTKLKNEGGTVSSIYAKITAFDKDNKEIGSLTTSDAKKAFADAFGIAVEEAPSAQGGDGSVTYITPKKVKISLSYPASPASKLFKLGGKYYIVKLMHIHIKEAGFYRYTLPLHASQPVAILEVWGQEFGSSYHYACLPGCNIQGSWGTEIFETKNAKLAKGDACTCSEANIKLKVLNLKGVGRTGTKQGRIYTAGGIELEVWID